MRRILVLIGDAPAGPYLAPGTRLGGHYLIGRLLGHGGFGVPRLAWDETLLKFGCGSRELPMRSVY